MYKSTLSAAEASARPMRESRIQLPARSLDLRDARASQRGLLISARPAALQPQRAGTLAAPIGQRHRVFWALAVRRALLYGSLESGCRLKKPLYSVAAQPFDAQQLLYARWVLYGATGCLFAAEASRLPRGKRRHSQLVCTHSIATSPRAESSER